MFYKNFEGLSKIIGDENTFSKNGSFRFIVTYL